VRPERAERQTEQAEHPDRRPGQRQPERTHAAVRRLREPRQLTERREVG